MWPLARSLLFLVHHVELKDLRRPAVFSKPSVALSEHYVRVPLDHAAAWNNRSFALRYLLETSYHTTNGPLIAYTGNEGPIEQFSTPEAAGFLF